MFYRRKILLGLLEACGGRLNNVDMEKLLFAYCTEIGVNHYDFFPHKFGCFSFLSYQDKNVLTNQGFLVDNDAFVLKRGKSVFTGLHAKDKQSLREFVRKTGALRGDALVRDIYLKHPYYACQSQIKDRVLTPSEKAVVDSFKPVKGTACLFTIGYEGLSIDAYVNKLIQHSVSAVVDVRRNPLSMKYGFSKTRFRNYLERAGIAYEHIPQLGIASAKRKNLKTSDDYRCLFEEYAKALPNAEKELQSVRHLLARHSRIALTCFEAVPTSCHRHKITELFRATSGWNTPIVHIA
jgi:hypothetical protein